MAEKKGTAFAGPTIGTVYPKGTQIIKNPDGTVTLVEPKEKGADSGKKTK